MTDPEAEKAAMTWLEGAVHRDGKWESMEDVTHRATLKAMLARPVMPADLSGDDCAAFNGGSSPYAIVRAGYYAHLTDKPAPAADSFIRPCDTRPVAPSESAPALPEDLTSEQIGVLVRAFDENEGYVLHARLDETFKALRRHMVKAATPPRYELETHYTTASHPTRSTFDSADEALEQAGARHRCHAGVSHTVVRAVKS